MDDLTIPTRGLVDSTVSVAQCAIDAPHSRRREWTYATLAVLCALVGYGAAIGTRAAPSAHPDVALLPGMGAVGTLLVGASVACAWWLARSRTRVQILARQLTSALRDAESALERARLEAERLARATSESADTLLLERGRLDLALSGGDLGLWDWNPKTGDLVVDDRWAHMLGLEVHEVERDTTAWSSRVHPEDMPLALDRLSTNLSGGSTPYETEHRMRHSDGRWRWIQARGKVVERDEHGVVTRFVGTHLDVTERRASGARLAESENRFRRLAEAAPIIVFTNDAQGQCDYVNQRWLELSGLTLEQSLGVGWALGIHAEDRDRCVAEYAAAFAARVPYEMEFRVVRPDGAVRSLLARAEARYSSSGDFDGYVGVSTDLTERREAEEATRVHREQLESLVRNLPGVAFRIACDAVWTKLFVSDAIECLTGYPASDFIGAVRNCGSITHPDDRGWVNARVDQAVSDHLPYSIEYRIVDKSGQAKWVNERAQVVFDGAKPLFLDGVMFDITAFREARLAAEAANRAKSEFLANMSHEIRTPLTAILGFADVLRGEDDLARSPEFRAETLNTIRSAGDHLMSVINDVLDLSKIEAGQMSAHRGETRWMEILGEVECILRPKAIEKGVEISLLVENPVPDLIVSEPTHMRQILTNLVANAVKFTDEGRVTVRVRSRGSRLEIDVEDTGPGMSSEQVAKLFKPFSQADSSMARKFGGTGLGLTISRRLAESMGGNVTLVRSAPDQGSLFRLELPLEPVLGSALTTAIAASRSRASAVEVRDDVRLCGRILLAEDGRDNQRLISLHLRRAGAEVDVAGNGQIALEMLDMAEASGRPYVLLVSDMQMPEMDGYTLARTLRSRGSKLPIVALTAHAMSEDRERCFEAGCDEYTTKPIDRTSLLSACAARMGPFVEPVPLRVAGPRARAGAPVRSLPT